MLSVQWGQESEFKRGLRNLLEQKLEEICGKSLLWWYIVVSSTKFRVCHHQDDWITAQYASVNQQFALHEENTELPDIKLYSVESRFHLDSCSIEHSARVWPSETQGVPKEVGTIQCVFKRWNVWYCVLRRYSKINSANSPASAASL